MEKILDDMKYKRYCCRRMYLSYVDTVDKQPLSINRRETLERKQN